MSFGWPVVLLAGLPYFAGPLVLRSEQTESAIRFVDIAADIGIDASISHGDLAKKWIAEANGSGAAVLDYDQDGWMDILLIGGATMDNLRETVTSQVPATVDRRIFLYRNRKGERFEDVTERSGLTLPFWGTGANAADYDNDGDVDILITAIGLDLLFRNEGHGRFTEVGRLAGLARTPAWHTGSSFGDIDADGDLDLFVTGYLDIEALPITGEAPVCDYRGLEVFCGPLDLVPGADILYLNNGDGTFTDISEAAGVLAERRGYGFTAVIEDFNRDSRPDIFVANDSAPNFLYVNQGSGTFSEDGLAAGVAYNADGKQQADMGACLGDYDSDGDLDMLTTTFSEDYFPLFRQQAPGQYEDVSSMTGLKHATTPHLGWACGFTDLDNDGDRDLWVANGHVYPSAAQLGTTEYEQPVSILENSSGQFTADRGATAMVRRNSYRGAASVDFDNDGRVDLLVVPIDGSPLLLRNRSASQRSWLGVSLRFNGVNGEGIGSQVRVEYCGERQFDTVRNGAGYASRSDPRVHFGIGACEGVERLTVTSPNGQEFTYADIKANQWLVVP